MRSPDLSDMKALIADDRADVRQLLDTTLRGIGVVHVDAMASGPGGLNLVALMTGGRSPSGSRTAEPLPAEVSRFSHDVASPLMCVIALSGLLVREAKAGERSTEDLKRIQAAAEEIAVMVRALGERAADDPIHHVRSS